MEIEERSERGGEREFSLNRETETERETERHKTRHRMLKAKHPR